MYVEVHYINTTRAYIIYTAARTIMGKISLWLAIVFVASALVIASGRRHTCEERCQGQPTAEMRRQCIGRCRMGPPFVMEEEWSRQEEETREQVGEGDNPYVFGGEHFLSAVHTRYGGMFALRNFHRLSKFLRGMEKYKLALLQVQPERFFSPNHMDADALFTVYSGEGAITVVWENKRHSFRLVPGTLFRLPPGTPYYIVNSHTRQPLIIAQFLITVNNPGSFEVCIHLYIVLFLFLD